MPVEIEKEEILDIKYNESDSNGWVGKIVSSMKIVKLHQIQLKIGSFGMCKIITNNMDLYGDVRGFIPIT